MKYKGLIMVFLLLLFFASCGETMEVAPPEQPVETLVVVTRDIRATVLPFTTLSDGAATRADVAMSVAEKEIKSAYVVQFNGTSASSMAVWVSLDVTNQLKNGTPMNGSFTLSKGAKSRVYVVANPKIVPTVGMTLQAFETVAYTVSTALPATGLPMAASQDVTVDDAFNTFQLKSSLAKLTFNQTGTLTLKGIPSAYSLAPVTAGDEAVRPSGVTYTATAAIVSGTAYYVPANLSGRVALSDKILRCATFAPAGSMYVVVNTNSTTYNVYLGDGSVSDFNVVANYVYTVSTTVNGMNALDMRVGIAPTVTALDGSGTANCYIVTSPNTWYSFSGMVMGNGVITPAHTAGSVSGDINSPAITPTPLTPASAEVLWETWNTTETPTTGSVVRGVYLANGRVVFRSGSTEGNAVVAVYKSGETDPCWSWHIWRVNTDPTTAYTTLPGYTSTSGNFDDTGTTTHPGLTMMHCNLGALSSAANDNLSTGLLYQWGRKDPLPGGADLTAASVAMAATPAGIPVIPSAAKQYTIAESIQQPTTFLKYGGDWCSVRNDNLWGTPLIGTVQIGGGIYNSHKGAKSIYDPCPLGWRVPAGYVYTNFNTTNFTWSNNGRLYSTVWFPASGHRGYDSVPLNSVGVGGGYWTSTPYANDPTNGNNLSFFNSSVSSAYGSYRVFGLSVRCVKE